MNYKLSSNNKIIIFALTIFLIILAGGLVLLFKMYFYKSQPTPGTGISNSKTPLKLTTFSSSEDFKNYLATVSSNNSALTFSGEKMMTNNLALPSAQTDTGTTTTAPGVGSSTAQPVDRVSDTNVQVLGIDEPDIVKTDGDNIYYSSQNQSGPIIYNGTLKPNMGVSNSMIRAPDMPYYYGNPGKTRIIQANPISNLSELNSLEASGNLLLSNHILIIQTYNKVSGYDVSDPKNPSLKWSYDLKNGTSIVSSRQYNNQVLLVTSNSINIGSPCPYMPLSKAGSDIAIPCTLIYHPIAPTTSDTTYTALTLDSGSGEVINKVGFVGSFQSVVYVSPNNLYVTFSDRMSYYQILYQFLTEQGADLLPSDILTHLQNVANLDISEQAKETEMQVSLTKYEASLDDNGRLKYQNDLQNRLKNYTSSHIRDLVRSGIAKIDLNGLKIINTADVPGTPLNQFSLDEYQNNLRITTTSDSSGFGSSDSVNDLYILDSNLQIVGSLTGLGQGERIYATRFLGQNGYLVTFKQTDPFFVLDLSDPRNPVQKGELKIPGYSSYLHPLPNGEILGVGSEQNKVKLSLFDVSNPANPTEVDNYNLDEYYTEVSNNHHAFLLDDKHQVFFLPGSKGGYIFSYQGNKLTLKTTDAKDLVQRALFINDYLYILSETSLAVFDENTWQQVKSLNFK